MADVIVADEGSAGTAATPITAEPAQAYGGYSHGYSHGYGAHPAYKSYDDYSAQAHANSGAGPATMYYMMGSVLLSYALLFVFMGFSCWYRPAQPVAFIPLDVESVQHAKPQGPVGELDAVWRKGFVTKVYAILCLQLAITVVICFSMMQFGGYSLAMWMMTDGYWTRTASFFGAIALICALMAQKNRFPHNFVLLGAFTACMSYVIGVTCTLYAAAGMGVLVVEAFAITSILFIGLTLFVMHSKIDFSFLGFILPTLLLVLMVWGLFTMLFFESFVFRQVYALGGTVLFALYILYDTHAIMTYLQYDEYILGAVNLYLDFINLFIMILQLLTGGRRE